MLLVLSSVCPAASIAGPSVLGEVESSSAVVYERRSSVEGQRVSRRTVSAASRRGFHKLFNMLTPSKSSHNLFNYFLSYF